MIHMKRTRSFILGFISATVLTTAVSALAQSELIAKLSSQTFFWQNAKIELEAYNINGYNYVRLRDAAGIFGVDVEYNGTDNSVRLGEEPQQIFIPLTETIPEHTKEPEKEHIADGTDYAKEDYSQYANQLVFNDTYTKAAYNTIRQSIVDRDEIIAGNNEDGYNSKYSYAHFVDSNQTIDKTGKTISAMNSVLGSMNGYYVYHLGTEPDVVDYWKYPGYSICKPTVHSHFTPANEATDSFIKGLEGLKEVQKIEKIATYVADRIFYETNGAYKGINEIFTAYTPVGGTCGSYASAFLYLCQRADIPCVTIADDIHAWNEVYAEGKWRTIDVGYYDLSRTDVFAKNYPRTDGSIEKTNFTKELLVPGSTKN